MTRKSKVRGFLGSVATLTAIVGITAPANAITFSYGGLGDNEQPVITKTVGGLTLTLNNPLDYDGDSVKANGTDAIVFEAGNAAEGLKFSSTDVGVSELPYSFELTFSQDVRLVSYDVTNNENDGEGAFFDLTQGGLSSENNSVATVGTSLPFTNTTSVFQAGVPILFQAGDLLTAPADTPDTEVFFLDNITVETAAVPFEFSPALGLLAVGGIWGASRLRKKLAANKVINELSA